MRIWVVRESEELVGLSDQLTNLNEHRVFGVHWALQPTPCLCVGMD